MTKRPSRRTGKNRQGHGWLCRFYVAHLHRPPCRWDVLLHELSLALAKPPAASQHPRPVPKGCFGRLIRLFCARHLPSDEPCNTAREQRNHWVFYVAVVSSVELTRESSSAEQARLRGPACGAAISQRASLGFLGRNYLRAQQDLAILGSRWLQLRCSPAGHCPLTWY